MAYKLTREDRRLAQQMALNQIGGYNLPTQSSATSSEPKKKSFLQDNISTGGSLAGALAGGAAGTAILPGVGTLIGALLGGAAGGGVGQVAENSLVGDDIGRDVLSESLWGGATALPFGALGKVAKAGGTVAKGLGSNASKAAAKDLLVEAGVKTMPKKSVTQLSLSDALRDAPARAAAERLGTVPVLSQLSKAPGKTTLEGKLGIKANNLLAQQYGPISRPTIRSSNPAKTFGHLADAGITKPSDVERVSNAITGADGILNRRVTEAVSKSANVDTSGLRNVFVDALDNYGVVDKDRKSLESIFRAQVGKLDGGAKGSLVGANATDALSTMKSLEAKIANLRGKGGNYRMSTPEREDMANVLQLVKDELQDRLYTAAGADKNIQSLLTPKLRKELIDLMPNNAKWAKYVDNNIMSAKDVGSVRSAQAPFVNASKIIEDAADNSFSVGGRMAANANGIRGAVLQGATDLVADPARRGIASVIRNTSGRTPRLSTGAVGQSLPQAASRIGGAGVARGMVAGTTPNDIDDINQQPSIQFDDEFGRQLDYPQADVPQNPLGYSSMELGQALMAALADGNTKAAQQLQSMYQLASEWEQSQVQQEKPLTQGQQERADLITALSNTEDVMDIGSINYGPIGGRINDIKARFNAADPETLSFKNTVQGLRAAITKARAGASLTAGEMKLLEQYTPSYTDSEQVVRSKLQALRQLYGDS